MKHILFISLLLGSLALFLTGCAKQESGTAAETGKPENVTVGKTNGDPLTDIAAKMKGLSSYEMVIEQKGQKMKMAMKMKNGEVTGMKSTMDNGGWTILNYEKKEMYIYDPNTKTAMKMQMTENDIKSGGSMPSLSDPDSIAELVAKKPNVESEKIDGVDCWKITDPSDNSIGWFDKQYGFVRQVKTKEETLKIQYERINAVPDSEFDLPAGVSVKSMDDVMKGMPTP